MNVKTNLNLTVNKIVINDNILSSSKILSAKHVVIMTLKIFALHRDLCLRKTLEGLGFSSIIVAFSLDKKCNLRWFLHKRRWSFESKCWNNFWVFWWEILLNFSSISFKVHRWYLKILRSFPLWFQPALVKATWQLKTFVRLIEKKKFSATAMIIVMQPELL